MLEVIKDVAVDTISQVIILGLSVVVSTIVAMAVGSWNKFIKDKAIINQLEISTMVQRTVEDKIVAGMSYLAEQEKKRIKIDPNFKFPSEDKLKIVADYVVPLVGEENIRKTGINLTKEIEQVLNKLRTNDNYPSIN